MHRAKTILRKMLALFQSATSAATGTLEVTCALYIIGHTISLPCKPYDTRQHIVRLCSPRLYAHPRARIRFLVISSGVFPL